MKLSTKYYRWRRRRIRAREKVARSNNTFLSSRDRENYIKFGFKWYQSLDLKFGADLTGRGMSVADKYELSHLNDYERENKPIPSVPDTHIDVTFQTVSDEAGNNYTLVLDNGVPRPDGTAYELYLKQQDKD